MDIKTRILIVEDSIADAELNKREALKALGSCLFEVVETEPDFLEKLSSFKPHLILSDYSMPEFDGLTALSLAIERAPETPVIIVTGSVNEDTAVECMTAGAVNYVIKQSIKRLGPAILHALRERENNLDRKRALDALHESETRYRNLFSLSPVGILVQDSNNIIIDVNESYCKITGYDKKDLIDHHISRIVPEKDLAIIDINTGRILNGEQLRHEAECIRKDTTVFFIELTESRVMLPDGKTGIMSIAHDITQRKIAEKELELKNRDLQYLSDYALKLTSLTDDTDIRKLILDELRLFTNAEFAVLSEYFSNEQVLSTKYSCVNQAVIDALIEQSGINITNISIPIDEHQFKEMHAGYIESFSLLSELTLGTLPTEADESFKKLTGIDRFFRIFLHIREELFGAAVIGFRPDQSDPDREMLKSFAYLTSLTIRRKKAEDELKEREERLRKILDSTQDAMIIIDAKGAIYLWNESAEKMFGYSANEVAGKNLHRLIVPQRFYQEHFEEFQGFVKSGQGPAIGKILEMTALRRNGDEFPVEIALSAINIDNSWFSVGSVRDITERKQSEKAIIKSEKRYHLLFDSNKDGITVIRINPENRESSFIEVNHAAAAMLGYSHDEMLAIPVYQLEIEISEKKIMQRQMVLLEKGTHSFETQFIHKSGQLIPVEVSASFVNYDGVPALMHIVRDISERKFREKLQKLQYNIANAVISADSLYDMYEAVRNELSKLIDTTNFFIAFYNPETGMMHAPFEKEEKDTMQTWPAENSLTGYLLKHQKSLLLSKKQITEMAESGLIDIIGNRSEVWLGAPLFQGKKAIGVIVVQSYDDPYAYNKDSKYILEQAAHELSNYLVRKDSEQFARKLSKAVEQNPVSIVITDKDGIIDYVNPKFTKVTGYTKAEAMGKKTSMLNSGVHDNLFYKDLWDTINSGNDWQGEMKNRKKDGSFYWENAIISPIKNDKGEITHFVAVKEDITEKKNIIEELKKAKEKAEESDRLKTAFLQNISHEIRTPLNGILGFSELLIQDWTSPEDRIEYNDAIQVSGKRLIEIVSNVLDIAFIETGQVILNPVRFRVNSLMQDLYSFYHIQALKKEIALKYELDYSDEKSEINADSKRIHQIMTNLLNNAIKYTKKGGINFGYKFSKGEITFWVRDTGIGINTSYHEKIFTRFYQADQSSARSYEGAGLGLSISHGLVMAMGGKIWFESEPGQGSVFSFSIPVIETVQLPDPESVAGNLKTSGDIILIADDDDTSYMLLMTSLKKQKAVIMRAENGLEAVEIVKNHPGINLVFMDVKMPEMDGLEATRVIKSFRPELPVVIQTAYAFHDNIEEAFAAGCDDYLTKPILTEKIHQIYEKYLGKGK